MFSKNRLLPALLVCGMTALFTSCFDARQDEDDWVEPTTGVVTTLREVEPGDFKIADERSVPNVADSRLIIESIDGDLDTMTLEEAKSIAATGDTTSATTNRTNQAVRTGGMGFFGYMMLGRMMMGGRGINRGAYINNSAYNRATNSAGSTMRSSARRTSGSKRNSGFGGSSRTRSTRSVGG